MKTCERKVFPEGEPMRDRGKDAVWEYHYSFPSYVSRIRGITIPKRVGVTLLCGEHGEYHRGETPNPSNEIPIPEQWRKVE
jgi:hypothetical protein